MDVVTHGGLCCGIKTIRSFPGLPTYTVEARTKRGTYDQDGAPDLCNPSARIGTTFHRPALPEETGLERLDRLIALVKEKRPSHMIEAVLNQHQMPYWKDVLKSRGFRIVSTHTNSNTGYRIYVFHKSWRNGVDVTEKEAKALLKGL